MTDQRFELLMKSQTEQLTEAEIAEGWHFCPDWDGLLVQQGDFQAGEFCLCLK